MRPSFYLAASALALGVSGYLALPREQWEGDYPALLARGWDWAEAPNCPSGEGYFALESDSASAEAYRGPDDRWLSSGTIAAPYTCRPITQPNFVQEVR